MAGGSKEHVDQVRESKFNRQRAETDVLRSNCGNEGYVFGTTSAWGQCEFHHVLPVSSLQDANILGGKLSSEKKDFIHKCMALTVWDINQQPNMIGLPTKKPYEEADKMTARKNATLASLKARNPANYEKGALPDLPSHLNDHPDYTAYVIDNLDSDLWPEVLKDHKQCKDIGKDIKTLLEQQSKRWKSWLITRGSKNGGAADCWVNRFDKKDVWFIALSMHRAPTKVDPPPNIYDRQKNTIAEWLGKIFNWS